MSAVTRHMTFDQYRDRYPDNVILERAGGMLQIRHLGAYQDICRDVAAAGYRGFELRP